MRDAPVPCPADKRSWHERDRRAAGTPRAATAVVHEAYSFACMRCGHGWEQAYEIEHHVDAEGHAVRDVHGGRPGVPSPLSSPTCHELRRPRRADHARRARSRPCATPRSPQQRTAPRTGPAAAPERRPPAAAAAGRSARPPLAPVRPAAPLPPQGELTERPAAGRACPFVGSGHAFEHLRPQREAVENERAPPLPEPLRVPVADSHTHLDMQAGTVEEGLAKAASVGVTTVVQVGCDVRGSRWAAETAGRARRRPRDRRPAPQRGAAHRARRPRRLVPAGRARARRGTAALDEALAEIDAAGRTPPGQGRRRDRPRLLPHRARGHGRPGGSFRAHIEIAKRHGKALVIHDRDAHADVLRVLEEEGAPERTVFHCYSGDAEMAEICAGAGYFMSFAGNVTFKNAQHAAGRARRRPARAGARGDRRALPDPGAVPRTAQRPVSHSGHGARDGRRAGHRRGRAGDGARGEHGARVRLLRVRYMTAPYAAGHPDTTLCSRVALESDGRSARFWSPDPDPSERLVAAWSVSA